MEKEVVNVQQYCYRVGEHVLYLNKDSADKFNELICPITEDFLIMELKAFAPGHIDDRVISALIDFDIRNELEECRVQY